MRVLSPQEIHHISGGATNTPVLDKILVNLLLGPLYPLAAFYNYLRINFFMK
jgi:hypothetical protein